MYNNIVLFLSMQDSMQIRTFYTLKTFEDFILEWEGNLTKQHIIDVYDKLKEESSFNKDWTKENLKDADGVKAWMWLTGSHLEEEIPVVRVDWNCKSHITVGRLLRSLYDVQERLYWDKNVAELFEVAKQHPNMTVVLF